MLGPMLMAHLPESEVDKLLEEHPLKVFTKKSFNKKEEFKKWLIRVKEEGVAIDEERTFDGITGVAVPVRDSREKVIASLGVAFISSAVDSKNLKQIIKEAKQTAQMISRNMGLPSNS
jgi:DNA-binding IclR family transcriptional regulator